ncbi:MAG TPA: EVE domain-containing protein [Xylella sp.]
MSTYTSYWLMKSEPDTFSIDDLQRAGTEPWNGVRNYQARNFIRDKMRLNDRVLFYHSNCKVPSIVGLARVASAAYPDESQFDQHSEYYDPRAKHEQPRWYLVDIAFERKLLTPITLHAIKQHAEALGEGFPLTTRGNRLSVFPVTTAQWKLLLSPE